MVLNVLWAKLRIWVPPPMAKTACQIAMYYRCEPSIAPVILLLQCRELILTHDENTAMPLLARCAASQCSNRDIFTVKQYL
jgi:hypothetical protein